MILHLPLRLPLVFRTLLGIALVFCGVAVHAQAPTITDPRNLTIGLNFSFSITMHSESTGNSTDSPDVLNIVVADDSLFDQVGFYYTSTDFIREDDNPADYTDVVSGLSADTYYYIKGISTSNGDGDWIKVRTKGQPITASTRLKSVNSVPANLYSASKTCYANQYRNTLTLLSSVNYATSYQWQFSTDSLRFATISDSVYSTGVNLSLPCDTLHFRSGFTYYVRVRGINPGNKGPWGSIYKYVNSLFPCVLTSPSGAITRFQFKLWTGAVEYATKYYFQMATDSAAFTKVIADTLTLTAQNKTLAGVTGTVWEANYTVGTGRAFNYVNNVKSKNYYVRVRAWNSKQAGYWSAVKRVSPLPTLTSGFTNVANNDVNRIVSDWFRFYDDPNFVESKWDFQVSKSATFATLDFNFANLLTRSQYISNLAYNTQYYIRVRSYVSGNPTPSAWATLTFTTQASPNIIVGYPTASQVLTNTQTQAYCTWEGSVTQYNWELQKTNAPTANYSFNSTSYKRSLTGYLARGGAYKIRVRGVNSTQGITGAWSPYVTFTVSATASPTPPRNDARLGVDEVVEEPTAWPNPAVDAFMLSLPVGTTQVRVSDLAGRSVLVQDAPLLTQQLGQSWPRGIYLVLAATPQGTQRLRVVKE